MNQTKAYTAIDFWHDLCELFRFRYDPEKDFNDDLPVRKRHATIPDLRLATTDKNDTYKASDGKTYGRKTTTTTGGATVFELDSTDTRTKTNVKPYMTKFDEYVFNEFAATDKYKYFSRDNYRLIKEHGFTSIVDGEHVSYRQAAELHPIKGTKGCSARYVCGYFTAMRIAMNMEANSHPLPSEVGQVVQNPV